MNWVGIICLALGIFVIALLALFIWAAISDKKNLSKSLQKKGLFDLETRMKLKEETEKNGIEATAKIIDTEWIGTNGTMSLMFRLKLEVTSDVDGGYVVDKNLCSDDENMSYNIDPTSYDVELLYADRFKKIGQTIPIKVHPENKMAIIIDIEKIANEEKYAIQQ